jgi:hypothetical protein
MEQMKNLPVADPIAHMFTRGNESFQEPGLNENLGYIKLLANLTKAVSTSEKGFWQAELDKLTQSMKRAGEELNANPVLRKKFGGQVNLVTMDAWSRIKQREGEELEFKELVQDYAKKDLSVMAGKRAEYGKALTSNPWKTA